MKKNFNISLAIIFLFTISIVSADSESPKTVKSDTVVNTSVIKLNDLDLVVEAWRDAWKKDQEKKVKLHEKQIEKIIWDDLFSALRNPSNGQVSVHRSYKDDSLFKVKKELFRGFKKGKTFGHKYRMLENYRQILLEQSSQSHVNLVDQSDSVDSD